MAWLSDADEIFLGGAAGGGKSWLLIGAAMTCQTKTLILRKEATQLQQLKDDLISIKHEQDHWRSIGYGGSLETVDGRKIELQGCFDRKDAEKFRGRAHDSKMFDEICLFSEETFRFVNAWNRTADPSQRCRIFATGNPPSRPEEEWVIKYWAPWLDPEHTNPAEPCELRWFASLDGKDVEVESGKEFEHVSKDGRKELIRPRSRTFIPARLEDNPILEQSGYRQVLQGLPEPLRSQLLYGDMTAGSEDDDWQVIPTSWVRDSMEKWVKHVNQNGFPVDDNGDPAIVTCYSLDPAEGGSDTMVLATRCNHIIGNLDSWPGKMIKKGGDDIVTKTLPKLTNLNACIFIDTLATPGGSAVAAYRIQMPKLKVVAVNFGSGSNYRDASGKLGMKNTRAEAYWRLRESLDPSLKHRGPRLLLPKNSDLLTEICSIRWKPTAGLVQIEDKEAVKKRIGHSPDHADAVAMAMLMDRSGKTAWVTIEETDKDDIAKEIDEMRKREQKTSQPFTYRADGKWMSSGNQSSSGGSGFMGVG